MLSSIKYKSFPDFKLRFATRSHLAKLISINGINSNLEIKISRITGANDRKILFDKPFKNRCIAVFLTDISSGALYRQAIKTDTITKEGFIMRSESLEETDQTQYLAIGY